MRDAPYELIILGGGITGLGVAQAAKERGVSTLLIEREEVCGQKTSAHSHRIMHGGFRYLKSGNIFRTVDSIAATSELLKEWPEHVTPLPCVMPLEQTGLKSKWPVKGAATFYNSLLSIKGASIPKAHILSASACEKAIPLLRTRVPYGALLWHDGLLKDHHVFIKALSKSLVDKVTFLQATVVHIKKVGSHFEVSTSQGTHRALSIVNALGAWIAEPQKSEHIIPSPTVNWCYGANVILDKCYESTYAIGLESLVEGQGKRLFFLVPRDNTSALGTVYEPCDEKRGGISEKTVADFVRSFSTLVPELGLSEKNIVRIEEGILPYKNIKQGTPQLFGTESYTAKERYVEILSTKYTTFLPQGRRAVEMVRGKSV